MCNLEYNAVIEYKDNGIISQMLLGAPKNTIDKVEQTRNHLSL